MPRDGKTVAIAPEDCRRLLDAPAADTPGAGFRIGPYFFQSLHTQDAG